MALTNTLSRKGRAWTNDARDRALAAKDAVGDSVESSLDTLGECVNRRPVTSLLVAVGVGVALGILLRGR